MHYNLLFDHTRDQGSLYFAIYTKTNVHGTHQLQSLVQHLVNNATSGRNIFDENASRRTLHTIENQMTEFVRNTAKYHLWIMFMLRILNIYGYTNSTTRPAFNEATVNTIIDRIGTEKGWSSTQTTVAKTFAQFDQFNRFMEIYREYKSTNVSEQLFDAAFEALQKHNVNYFARNLMELDYKDYYIYCILNTDVNFPLKEWLFNSLPTVNGSNSHPTGVTNPNVPWQPSTASPPRKFELDAPNFIQFLLRTLNDSNLPIITPNLTRQTSGQLHTQFPQLMKIIFSPNMAFSNPSMLDHIRTNDFITNLRASLNVTDPAAQRFNLRMALLLFSKLGFTRQMKNNRWMLEPYVDWLSFVKKAVNENTPHPLMRVFPVNSTTEMVNFVSYLERGDISRIMTETINLINETIDVLHRSIIVDKTEIVESYKRNTENLRYMRNMILKSVNVPPFIKGEQAKSWHTGMLRDIPNGFAFQFMTTPRTSIDTVSTLKGKTSDEIRAIHTELLDKIRTFKLGELEAIHQSLRAEYYKSSKEMQSLNYSIVASQRRQIEKYIGDYDRNKDAIAYQINYLQRYLALMGIFWDYYDPHIFAEFDFKRVLEVLDEQITKDYTSGIRIVNMLESIDNTIKNHFKTENTPIA